MSNSEIAAKINERLPFREDMTAADYSHRLSAIRMLASPYKRKRPRRATRNSYTDYYSMVIGEVLKTIRSHGRDYVFSEEQVMDLIRYEPLAGIEYLGEGIWEVWLPGRRRAA